VVTFTSTPTKTPTPTGPWIYQNKELWWFNGEKPSGYQWCVTLAGVNPPPAQTYDWQVVDGVSKVDLALACQSVGDAYSTLDAIGLISTAASGHKAWGDVVVSVSVEGEESARIETQVFAPHRAIHLRDEDHDPGGLGFQSLIWYHTEDNFDRIVDPDPGHNEKFTCEPTPDYEGADWLAEAHWSQLSKTEEWYDNIQMIGSTMYPVASPPPPTPSPLSDVKVDHWFGDWRCGSVIPGKGVKALSDVKWQRYLDHGRHE
jgi:hypothetical protein